MNAARKPRDRREAARMLVVDTREKRIEESTAARLSTFLQSGDLLIVNDAASLPAALHTNDGTLELRLLGAIDNSRAEAIAFGPGDWRQRTEDRPAPRTLVAHEQLEFQGGLRAHIDEVFRDSPRHVLLHFEQRGAELFSAIYRAGKPVQYSYLEGPLALWDVQTAYAARPWSAEMPSAGASLSFGVLKSLRDRGVHLATLTHAAGLSSTGDAALDARLPLTERYEIPEETVRAISEAKKRGAQIIAVGTTVVRALEGSAEQHGELHAGAGSTNLHLGPGYSLKVVNALFTGVHDPTASHFALLAAFASQQLLKQVSAEAETRGFLGHEFGDVCLFL
ncbi:MAG: S-adenosylmethionine:tRNA ribosyltransferase-isomerase [Myxococcaceae bacterium]